MRRSYPAALVALALLALVARVPPVLAQTSIVTPVLRGAAAVADGTLAAPYEVLGKECYPFLFFEDDKAKGFLVDQLAGVSTAEAPFNVRYHISNTTYDGSLHLLETGDYNMAASCFTRTIARELNIVDFSWSSFSAGQCLLQNRQNAPFRLTSAFFTHENIEILAALFLAFVVFAHLVWFCEKDKNPDFKGDGSYSDGLWHGIWFCAVTFSTVGYGDKSPITSAGKMTSLLWMIIGLGFYCLFTGTLAAYLTNSTQVPGQWGWQDIRDNNQIKVGTTAGTSTLARLLDSGVKVPADRLVDSRQAAYAALKSGDMDVYVVDWPLVYGDMRRGAISNTDLVCYEKRNDESYGMAFPQNAVLHPGLREAMSKINAGLIAFEKDKRKDEAFSLYFLAESEVSGAEEDSGDVVREVLHWSQTTAIAFAVLACLVVGWSIVAARRVHRERAERYRRREAGEAEENTELNGGVAKTRDLLKLVASLESLEQRLVAAGVIQPKLSALQRLKSMSPGTIVARAVAAEGGGGG
eukprot:CAMPEP_0197580844 /NCGR_PEP_ID=MMETSP1326-20131121/4537_1 /TAXON_ID=1155430 /ORGANISM="Genus nov. species nov., Strain RCC2288" /LENGTH=523 /DNA_ID=CAMNT_0043144667 /DNA_START=123 /DNA_END=1690 /DNA_ORIENTATION=-